MDLMDALAIDAICQSGYLHGGLNGIGTVPGRASKVLAGSRPALEFMVGG